MRPPLENGPTSENDEDDELIAKNKDYRYVPERMTWDPNCYECKVRYRDPKAKDLVMYLPAWRYKVTILHDRGNTSILIYAIMEREAAKFIFHSLPFMQR